MENYVELLKKNNQSHLLKYIEMASESDKKKLIGQVEKIDFEQINELYEISKKDNKKIMKSYIIEHTKFTDKYKMPEDKFEELNSLGEEIIRKGQYAVVTMAGGQGTRLGHNGPKGTFLLNVSPKPKYLFEIIADGLNKANKKYNTVLNWYIMTSVENNESTVNFFEEHNVF